MGILVKKRYISFLIILIVLITSSIIMFIHKNSFYNVLKKAGYANYEANILESGFNDNGNEFNIVILNRFSTVALVYMEKDKRGKWEVSYTGGKSSIDNKFLTIGWMNEAGFKYYKQSDEPIFETEWHVIYYGENAIRSIEIPLSELPPGVAVNVQQSGNTYLIHTVSYIDPEILNQIDMKMILEETNCVESFKLIE